MNEIQEIHAKNKREIEESNTAGDDLQAGAVDHLKRHKSTIGVRPDSSFEEVS